MPPQWSRRRALNTVVSEGAALLHSEGSVAHLPGFSRDFDCFDSENQWDVGIKP